MTEKLEAQDLQLLEEKQITLDEFSNQLKNFENGFSKIKLTKAATLENGITAFSSADADQYAALYDDRKNTYSISRFVPASGAATRMFKDLFTFSNSFDKEGEADTILESATKFAFKQQVESFCQAEGIDVSNNLSKEDKKKVIDFIIGSAGLNYGSLPKGMIPFHLYGDEGRTAFEEHLVEAALYNADANNVAKVHFTVSPEHQSKIEQLINETKGKYEAKYGVSYEITYSIQEPSTDTVAVDMENNPFRLSSGKILFRPGGHGALLKNLDNLDADIVFIKNIDNVVHDRFKDTTVLYKKALAGYLIEIREKVDSYVTALKNGEPSQDELATIAEFMKSIGVSVDTVNKENLLKNLNRPIRVCGMVKNEGEPGGGPFWVLGNNGQESLQIVEKSQVDLDNQGDILAGSTHFNPVDLICSISDYEKKGFDLLNFRDDQTGFITEKSVEGKDVKAQELPGLWNGAMADWITLFVEVPLITFNPVKTLKDLLRDPHQGQDK